MCASLQKVWYCGAEIFLSLHRDLIGPVAWRRSVFLSCDGRALGVVAMSSGDVAMN